MTKSSPLQNRFIFKIKYLKGRVFRPLKERDFFDPLTDSKKCAQNIFKYILKSSYHMVSLDKDIEKFDREKRGDDRINLQRILLLFFR